MEYVIGWMTVKPGQRQTFLAASEPFVAATRAEPGVLFFELDISAEAPDVVVAIEGYADAGSHERHVKSPHFSQFWAIFERYVVHGRFENVFADRTRTDEVTPDPA